MNHHKYYDLWHIHTSISLLKIKTDSVKVASVCKIHDAEVMGSIKLNITMVLFPARWHVSRLMSTVCYPLHDSGYLCDDV